MREAQTKPPPPRADTDKINWIPGQALLLASPDRTIRPGLATNLPGLQRWLEYKLRAAGLSSAALWRFRSAHHGLPVRAKRSTFRGVRLARFLAGSVLLAWMR